MDAILDSEFNVIYWGGEELETVKLSTNSQYVAAYLSKEEPYFTGISGGKIFAIKSNQIITIEQE